MTASKGSRRREAAPQIGGDEEMLKVTIDDVLRAVSSLYDDRLKPFGRVILKRIRENYAADEAYATGSPYEHADPETAPRVDPRKLRRVCENCKLLQVLREEGREYSVIFLNQPACFVDVCSIYDCYPLDMWAAAAMYFQSLAYGEMVLPGGRYACARALFARQLPFLEGRCLGEICHIVQMAISQKRLLGYQEGHLVPFQHSEEWVKEQCAYAQQPTSEPSLPLATIEDARNGLWELLYNGAPWAEDRAAHRSRGADPVGMQPGGVTLSNVKRLFRSRFDIELSETALGHSRLHSLLVDPRLSDICCVELQRSGQVMVRPLHHPSMPVCLMSASVSHHGDMALPALQMDMYPRGTFSSQQQVPSQPLPVALEAAKPAGYAVQPPRCWQTPRKGLSFCSTEGSTGGASDEHEVGSFCSSGHMDLRIKNTFIHFDNAGYSDDEDDDASGTDGATSTCSSNPRRRRRRAASVPRSFKSPVDSCSGDDSNSPSAEVSPRRELPIWLRPKQPNQPSLIRKERAATISV